MYDALQAAAALARVQRSGTQAAAEEVSVIMSACEVNYRNAAVTQCVCVCSPDDWQFYPSYFDSLFHLMDQSWSPPEEGEQ